MIITAQITADRVAISVSALCAIHCLFTPALLIMISGVLPLSIDNELIHFFVLMAAIPVSFVALALGQRNHKTATIFVLGVFGLTVLSAAWFLGEANLGEYGEKALTVLGSILVVYAHIRNYRRCRAVNCDCCHEDISGKIDMQNSSS